MTASEQMLLALIRASLFDVPLSIEGDVDWDAVYREAQAQSVAFLVAESVPEQFKAQWINSSYHSIAHYVRILHSQDEIVKLFAEAGIRIAILKGTAAAIYYPEPSRRAMGDIDFLVPQDQYDRSVELMLQNGYQITHHNDAYTRHIGFTKNSISFELHHHFSYDDLDIETYLIEGLNHAEEASIEGISFPMLPALPNGLVLLAHICNHLKKGMGLRQIIDWMMYVNSVLDDTFWESSFKDAAKSVGLDKLAAGVTRMCVLYLGLEEKVSWARNVDDDLCRRLMEIVLESGNFGRKQGSGNDVEKVLTMFKMQGLFRYLQCAGESNWKSYKNHHWLKPFCWLYQIFRYIRQGIHSKRGRRMLLDAERSNERYSVLRELGVN